MTLACMGTATAAFAGRYNVSRIAGVPIHFASHQLCSGVFVGGFEPEDFFNEAIAPKLAPISGFIRYEIDRQRQEVRTSLAGLMHSRAIFDGPYGCRVVHPGNEARFFRGEGEQQPAALPPPIAGPDVVTPDNAKLARRSTMRLPRTPPGRAGSPRPSWCCIAAASSANAMRPA